MDYKSQSDSLNELALALAKAQSEMEVATKNCNLSHFKSKFADLKEIVRASRPYLTKNGLSVAQPLDFDGERTILRTILMHSSGQFLSSRMVINPSKAGDQEEGKSITYKRRYAYASLIGVICEEEVDHDNAPVKPYNGAKLTLEQVKSLHDLMEANFTSVPEATAYLIAEMGVRSLGDIPSHRYQEAIEILK